MRRYGNEGKPFLRGSVASPTNFRGGTMKLEMKVKVTSHKRQLLHLRLTTSTRGRRKAGRESDDVLIKRMEEAEGYELK